MKRLAFFPVIVAGTPLLAQDGASEAVGAALGGFIGLLIVIVVGVAIGWLASLIVKGSGSGFWGNVMFGVGGSFLAGWILPLLGIQFGGALGRLIAALVGAIALVLIFRMIRKNVG